VRADRLHVRKVPGSHFSMMKAPHIAFLGEQLTQALVATAFQQEADA